MLFWVLLRYTMGSQKWRKNELGHIQMDSNSNAVDYKKAPNPNPKLGYSNLALIGGETGIRTQEAFQGLHDFESCAFDHSAISPKYQ